MTKREFLEKFAVQFLANYAAKNYEDWCSYGLHDRFNKLPVEDAFDIANKNWEEFDKQEEKNWDNQ